MAVTPRDRISNLFITDSKYISTRHTAKSYIFVTQQSHSNRLAVKPNTVSVNISGLLLRILFIVGNSSIAPKEPIAAHQQL
jgi:hypothetical protein